MKIYQCHTFGNFYMVYNLKDWDLLPAINIDFDDKDDDDNCIKIAWLCFEIGYDF